MRNTKASKYSTISAKLFWIVVILIIGVGTYAFLYYLYLPKYRELQKYRNQSIQLQQQLDTLKTQNIALQKHIERLESDTFHIEAVARTRLGMQKPDETIFILKPKPHETGSR